MYYSICEVKGVFEGSGNVQIASQRALSVYISENVFEIQISLEDNYKVA